MSKFLKDHAAGLLWGLLGSIVMALALGGWSAHAFISELATREEVMVLAGKADYVLDRQIESLVGQIAYLERKPHLTASERQQLDYLRGQLKQLRRVRDGK